MWKILNIAVLFIVGVRAFNNVEFQRKYCYDDYSVRKTNYYFDFTYGSGLTPTSPKGFVCENFVLTKADLDFMARSNFAFTQSTMVVFRNCEIEYFNEFLVSKFPKLWGIFFDNCKVGFKNPTVYAFPIISNGFFHLGFHGCNIYDNTNSRALQKFTRLQGIYIQNSTLQYPIIDDQFLPIFTEL